MELKLSKMCRCVANSDGRCVAEKCEGAIVAFDVKISGPEQAKEFYEQITTLLGGASHETHDFQH